MAQDDSNWCCPRHQRLDELRRVTGADYDDARETFVDDITMAVANAVQAGIRPEDIRADFEAVLSIQAPR
jgi:hypothetical protein